MYGNFSKDEMDSLYRVIFSRRDVRSGFTGEPIKDEVLRRILDAAHHGPSVGFSQPWNFILVKDIHTRQKIKESFEQEKIRAAKDLEEPRRSKYLALKLEGIVESSLNICVTYDSSKFGPFVIGRAGIPETGAYSVCCAVQNLWLAARVENIGVGWVSILSNDVVRNALDMPSHILPIAYLCVGHVSSFADKPDLENVGWLPRLNLDDVTYNEKWGRT